ncbi:MAG TPA: hypothetical protein VFM59_00175 [Salinimicrobium sp.]|nr:hypothetical protein [Salinimicrobium sp.]
MEPGEKKTLSNLISGIRERNFSRCNRRISLKKAKEKLGYFHKSEIESCRNNINEASAKNEGIA